MKARNLISIVVVLMAVAGIFTYVLFTSNSKKVPSLPNLGAIVKNSGGSAMLIAECADKSYLYTNSDVIVTGIVEKVETKDEEGQIYTYSSISIKNFEKENFNSNELTIKTPGGCMGTTCVVIEDQPILHENKSVRIYLKQIGNEFSIVCGIMGVESLEGLSIVGQ